MAVENNIDIAQQGAMLTCDEARVDRMNVYFELGEVEKYEELKALWIAARLDIQARIPDFVYGETII